MNDLKVHGITSWFHQVESGQDGQASQIETMRHEMQTSSAILLLASPETHHSRFIN